MSNAEIDTKKCSELVDALAESSIAIIKKGTLSSEDRADLQDNVQLIQQMVVILK